MKIGKNFLNKLKKKKTTHHTPEGKKFNKVDIVKQQWFSNSLLTGPFTLLKIEDPP